MVHLILNDDNSVQAALHESCGAPTEAHVTVEDADWAKVAAYDHSKVYCIGGILSVEPGYLQATQNARLEMDLTRIIQNMLDTRARARNYDGIFSLCSYATSANPKFSAEGMAGVRWRDDVWAYAYGVLNDALAGRIPTPTAESIVAGAPTFSWPDTEL